MGTDPAAGRHDEDWGEVAVVDFTSPDAPAEFTASLLHTGFAVLVNHPLPAPLVQQVFDEWSAFFGSEAKYRYAVVFETSACSATSASVGLEPDSTSSLAASISA